MDPSKIVKLAVIGCVVLGLLALYRRPHDVKLGRAIHWLLVALAGVSTLAYVDFGRFHRGAGYVHNWEMFHYVMPSKYFAELGYDGLYQAALRRHLLVAPGDVFLVDDDPRSHLRLCFGNQSEGVIRRGVEILAELVCERLDASPGDGPRPPAEWTPLV